MPYTVKSSFEPDQKTITDSILLTTKKLLGIAEEYHAFDIDVITAINAALFTLNQLGVGPRYPFMVTGEEETYSDFLGDKKPFYQGIQQYVYMRARLMFDPPTNSFIVKSFEDQCREFEWRFMVQPITDDTLPDRDKPIVNPDEPDTPIDPPDIPTEPDEPEEPLPPLEPLPPTDEDDDDNVGDLVRKFI